MHVLTNVRMTASKAPMNVVPSFAGSASGRIDQATVDEIASWKQNGYVAPLALWRIIDIAGGRLREDAANAWTALSSKVADSEVPSLRRTATRCASLRRARTLARARRAFRSPAARRI